MKTDLESGDAPAARAAPGGGVLRAGRGRVFDEFDEASVEHMEVIIETREARREGDANPSVQASLRWENTYDRMVVA